MQLLLSPYQHIFLFYLIFRSQSLKYSILYIVSIIYLLSLTVRQKKMPPTRTRTLRTLQTEEGRALIFPCTTIYWHWPLLHIKHPAFIKKRKKRNHLTRAASTGSCFTVRCAQHVDQTRSRTNSEGGKWPKVRDKREVWRIRSSSLIPRRLSWTSKISRCLVARSMTSSTPKTPTWSRSTLFWEMYKFCWRLLGFLRAPTGRTEVSLFVLRLVLFFHLPLNFRKTGLHCQQTQTTKGWVHSTKHHCLCLHQTNISDALKKVLNGGGAFFIPWTIFGKLSAC